MEETQEYDHMTKTSFEMKNGKLRTEYNRNAGGKLPSAADRGRSDKTAEEGKPAQLPLSQILKRKKGLEGRVGEH